jgi:hypothetical protein
MRIASMAFFALSIAFIGIGITGQRTFLYVGFAFLALAIARLVRVSAKQ